MEWLTIVYFVYSFIAFYFLFLFILIYVQNRERIFSCPKITKNYSLSIVVPCYNEEKSIAGTIQALLDSSYKKLEKIINRVSEENIFLVSRALSIKPRTRVSKIDALKEIIRAWCMNPEEILVKEALVKPHRTLIDPFKEEQHDKDTWPIFKRVAKAGTASKIV